MNRNPRRGKPVIEQLVFSSDKFETYSRRLAAIGKTPYSQSRVVREIFGAQCYGYYCGKIPTKKVIYDVDRASLVEFYCDDCIDHNLDPETTKLKIV